MLKIGNMNIEVPIFQGGMAIGASMSGLASAVSNSGGLGIIAATGLSVEELKEEIRKAKELMTNPKGVLGVNIMFAATNFSELVDASIESGIDAIVFGAGFSRDIFARVKDTATKIIPIVSSLKLALISEKLGADAIVVEGGNAGGHLGTDKDSWDILPEIVEKISIPVIGAGGVMNEEDAKKMMDIGVDGIQMGSRFIASEECEVDNFFKEMYINAREGDVVQIMSSAGLPANAIISPYVEKLLDGFSEIPKKCTSCLKKCTRNFCVNQKLVEAHDGFLDTGIFFAGKDAWKINEILPVKEIIERFKKVLE